MKWSPGTGMERLQAQVDRQRQLVMYGRLASGLVHEINNPLDGVLNCLRMVRAGRLGAEREREYLKLAEQEIFRVASLTKRLLGLAREEPLRPVPTNVNELVQKTLFFVDYRMTSARVRLETAFAPRLPRVKLDPMMITQVMVNLMLNAIESMPEGGVMSVGTASDRQWLCISISDTGHGIPPQDVGRVFQPFFSTKKGSGTGLGLAIVQNVVERHRGDIRVQSAEGKGTTFTVLLPRR
jgi:signal transduction histidine kinase